MTTKTTLLRNLRNPENKVVQQSIAGLRAHGWLEEGALSALNLRFAHLQSTDLNTANLQKTDLSLADLRWADLTNADLSGAQLNKANLYGADLNGTNLRGANLIKANLQGAINIGLAQLAQANCLKGAIMPDGSTYDGRFNLPGDLASARLQQVNVETISIEARGKSIKPFTQKATLPQLINRLRSADSRQVIQAVEELRARGKHSDGGLRWRYLRFVHLQSADLSSADLCKSDLSLANLKWSNLEDSNLQGTRLIKTDLRGSNFANANLYGAHLAHANLRGAINLSTEQLTQASRLQGAMMPNGSRYDGRYNLVGDLANARFARIDPNDPEAMAAFYGVSLDEYQSGQSWIATHPTRPWFEISHKNNRTNVDAVMSKFFELERQSVN